MLQHGTHPRFSKQTFLFYGIIGKFRSQRLVTNDSRQIQILAGLDKRLAALGYGFEIGIAGILIQLLRELLVRVFQVNHGIVITRRLRKCCHLSCPLTVQV